MQFSYFLCQKFNFEHIDATLSLICLSIKYTRVLDCEDCPMTKYESLGGLYNKTSLLVLEAGHSRSRFLSVVSSEHILLTCTWLSYPSAVP